MGLLPILLLVTASSALSGRQKTNMLDVEMLSTWPGSIASEVDSQRQQGRPGIMAAHIRAESKFTNGGLDSAAVVLPKDPNVGTKLRWVDMKPYRDHDNGDYIYPCTPSGGIKAMMSGHEFVLFGTAGKRPASWRSWDHQNCIHYPRTDHTNPWFAEAVGLRYFPKQDKFPKRDKDEMFVDCYDFANKDDEITCWRWQVKPACYRQVADEIATYFVQHRDYSKLSLFGTGSDSDRLSQDCSGEPWNGAQGSAHDWMNKTKGEDAMCWTFTWYFKALYCQYQREKKYSCADYS